MSTTLERFINLNRISMTAELVGDNPNMDNMPDGSTHWRCVLRHKGRQMSVYFSQGPAICREPTAEDLLDCLASDSGALDETFEDWCIAYGYDTDSRKAERIYKTCCKQASSLRRLLGDVLYNELLFDVER